MKAFITALGVVILCAFIASFSNPPPVNAGTVAANIPLIETPEPYNPYFSSKTITTDEGPIIVEDTIKGPPSPPPGYEEERVAVSLPEPGQSLSTNSLTVPAYEWVFGCSAVSAAMIAGYYDRNGFPNMYTGPTNGGVAPLDNSNWPDWTDGYGDTWSNNPLVASHQWLDGHTTHGSIDDYWVRVHSTAQDPYLTGGWPQHAWGTAVGDYMKTSQSAYNNIDGATHFYNWVSYSAPLTCSDMVTEEISSLDGTYGRKLFYQARGYIVTDCYNQRTDNQITGGFSFAQYKAEIDAGHPVLLSLEGHSIVGVGYDTISNTVYLHNTWDNLTHSMTWGGSYYGMPLRSVSIVHIVPPPPGSFNKTSPANGAILQTTNPTLSWGPSSRADSYEYCYDTTNDNNCSSWTSVGMNTSVTLTGLSNNTTYYWQVRARNAGGTTYANGSFSAFGSFTIFIPPPTAFTKYFPAADAANIPINPVLDWQDSPGATVYSYCIDPVSNNTCDTTWKTTGTTSQVQLSDLGFGFTYEWQVAASGPGGVTFANGGETSFWDFITVGPGPFNKNNPASPVPTNPILTWGTSNGATGYEYCIDTTNDHACANWISIGANTSVYLAGLTINTEYYWQVRAINADGITYATGYYENFYSFVPSSRSFGKLSPANGAVGIPIDPTITWQILAGATSYEYCNDTTNDFNCSNWVNVGQNTSSTITGLDYLTTYYWQVRTIGAIPLLADNTIFWSFTTVNEPPASFNKVSPDNGASGMATHLSLNWESSSRVSSYAYCIDTSNDNACSNWISVGNTTSVDIGGLLNNTLYYWQVRATNDGGTTYANESPTAFWSFATIEAPPGAFTKVAPENLATGVVTHPELTWGTSSGVSYYEYCYDMSTDLSCANWIGTGRDIYGDLAGLSYNHTYHWQVRAVNTGGITYANTDETAYWYFTVVAPPAFSKTAPISGAVGVTDNPILDWEDSPGAINYEYCMDTSEDNTCSDWIGTGSSSHAELFGLNNFATYYWQVRVVNADGIEYANASEAAYWSFTTVNKLYLPITMR